MKRGSSSSAPIIVWFQQDLRLADNGALTAAIARGGPVLPVFIWAPEEEGSWVPGAASQWWLHQSLRRLDTQLRALGAKLLLYEGPTEKILRELLTATRAAGVFWNRRYEPHARRREARLQAFLRAENYEVQDFPGALLFEPGVIRNKQGRPFQVFTPFWKHCMGLPSPSDPLPRPRKLLSCARCPEGQSLESLRLEPVPDWAGGLRAAWQPGETAALTRVKEFAHESLSAYNELRNRPDLAGTSSLSPHLHFGEVSPRQIWHQLEQKGPADRPQSQFVAELGWREFSHHLLHHFPHTDTQPLRAEFGNFPWRDQPGWLSAWQRGRTGYPLVDAGMRQLWKTGWMHNRVRMVAASFLVKDLMIPWQEGARWFWDTLVDADLAQNSLGWQWVAGCGADAAPFFRVFNPSSQGEKFDPQGAYVRRWVPELTELPVPWIHQPSSAPPEVLRRARIELGKTYPTPLVNHTIAREVALEAYASLKAKRSSPARS